MGKQTITINTCDRCGVASLDGNILHNVTISLPGKFTRAFSWELCGGCVDALGADIRNHPKTQAPVEVDVNA